MRGKFAVWRDLLGSLHWRGDERVLDLGRGRGRSAVLLLAAGCAPRGRTVGVDIWSSRDRSGNAIAVTGANAATVGVADRVELHTADMRKLPFAGHSFDLIVSNVAIHNIRDDADRAIDEAWRVLRPGGRLLIADISKSRQYGTRLAALGAHVVRRPLGWRMCWGEPWMPSVLIEARRAASGGPVVSSS